MLLDIAGARVDTVGVPIEDYYSVADAARMLGVSVDSIYVAIKKGQLVTKRHGKVHFIHKDELDRYRKEKRKAGRPREKRKYERKD